MQRYPQHNSQFQIRPLFRVLAAIVLVVLSFVLGGGVAQLLSSESTGFALDQCSGRGRVVCELGNWVSSAVPDHVQLPMEIAARVIASLSLLYVALRLLLPLVFRRRSK